MDRLDDRILPRLSRRPELLLLVAALLFVGGAATTVVRSQSTRSGLPAGGASQEVDGGPLGVPERILLAPDDARASLPVIGVLVGPGSGVDLRDYIAQRSAELTQLAQRDPGLVLSAIVTLDTPLTALAIQALADDSGVRIRAGRFALPLAGSPRERTLVTRGGLPAALLPLLTQRAINARAEAIELDALIPSTQDRGFIAQYRRDRDRSWAIADAVGIGGCACVYAVEVEAATAALAALAAADGITLVDPAPISARGERVIFLAAIRR